MPLLLSGRCGRSAEAGIGDDISEPVMPSNLRTEMNRLSRVLGWLSAKPRLIGLFLLCALPSGLNFAILTPPGQMPDEPAHLARADGLLRGKVIGVRKPSEQPDAKASDLWVGVKIDSSLFSVAFGHTTRIGGRNVTTAADLDANHAIGWGLGRVFVNIPNTATYFPAIYLPATLGLAAGIVSGGSPEQCLIVARIFMLGAFLAVASWALWVAAFGEALLLTVLLLPMTLFLAGSINPDGMLIATACLCAASLTNWKNRQPRAKYIVAVGLVLIAATKAPYIGLLGFLLLPLDATGLIKRLRLTAIAVFPVLLWVALVVLFISVPFLKPDYHPGPLWAGDRTVTFDHTNSAANIGILLRHPSYLLSLPYDLFDTDGLQKLHEGIGVLGLLTLQFPDFYYQAWIVALIATAVGLVFTTHGDIPTGKRLLMVNGCALVLLALTAWAVTIAQYVNWSEVGAPAIDGVQGRYFLLLLPFLILAIPISRRYSKLAPIVPAIPTLLIGLFDLGFLPVQTVYHFYIH